MNKQELIKLYKYCNEISLKKNKTKKYELFHNIIFDINNRIKDSVIYGDDYLILYDDIYNPLISEILPELKEYLYPFKITYRPKKKIELNLWEKLFNDNYYVLFINWKKKIINTKIYNLFNKYINFNQNKINNYSDYKSSDESFEMDFTNEYI